MSAAIGINTGLDCFLRGVYKMALTQHGSFFINKSTTQDEDVANCPKSRKSNYITDWGNCTSYASYSILPTQYKSWGVDHHANEVTSEANLLSRGQVSIQVEAEAMVVDYDEVWLVQ